MKIAYLKLENFMLYKKFNRKFEDKDIIGILCEYEDNPTRSNRGGKSTIPEAIKYCLFGLSRAKKEINLIHHGEEVMTVEVGLIDDDGKTYTIKRGRQGNARKNSGLLECDWVDKKKEAQEEINKLLGCNGEELELTNFFKQSDINQFMELGSTKQKEHLMKWFKQLHWPKLTDAVGEDLTEKRRELTQQRTKLETLEEDLIDPKDVNFKIKKVQVNMEARNERLAKLLKKQKKLEKEIKTDDEIEELQEQLEEVESEISDVEESVEEQKELKGKYKKSKKALKAWKKKTSKMVKFYPKLLKDYKEVIFQCEQEKKQLTKTLKDIGGKFCGVCPVLNEGCDRIKADPKQIKKMNKRVKELDVERQQFQGKIEALEESREVEQLVEDFKNKVKTLKDRMTKAKSPVDKLKGLKTKYESLKAKIEKASDTSGNEELEIIEEKIQESKSGLDSLNQKLGQYQSQIVRYKKAKKKISKIEDTIKELEGEIEDLKYLAFMFGKNGIPSQEIENAFQEVEDEINFILGRMGTSLEVSFNADRELGTWEEECVGCGFRFPKGYRKSECSQCGETRQKKRKDELHLSVMENGNETNFEMESGGGKTFVSLAVRIALTRLKQRQTGSHFSVLFLDEIDSALDDDAREKIMKLVTTVLMQDFNFQQIFWVSHNKKIQESVPHTLKVIRFKEYAKARWN